MVAEARRLPRRRRAQTRELLLLAGALVAEETVTRSDDGLLAEWLSHVRFDDVLQVATQLQLYLASGDAPTAGPSDAWEQAWSIRAHRDQVLAVDTSGHRPIAKSTAYTVFDHERDFRAQLARVLLSSERVRDRSVLRGSYPVPDPGGDDAPTIGEALGAMADREVDRIGGFAAPIIEVGAVGFAGHPLVRDLLARITQEAADPASGASPAHVYQEVLDRFGWQLRPGLTVTDLALALRALLLGYLVMGRIWPEGARREIVWGPDGDTRTGVSLAFEGVIRRFAEPAPDPTPAGASRG